MSFHATCVQEFHLSCFANMAKSDREIIQKHLSLQFLTTTADPLLRVVSEI